VIEVYKFKLIRSKIWFSNLIKASVCKLCFCSVSCLLRHANNCLPLLYCRNFLKHAIPNHYDSSHRNKRVHFYWTMRVRLTGSQPFYDLKPLGQPVISTRTTSSRTTNLIEFLFVQKNYIHQNNNKKTTTKFNEIFVFVYLASIGRCMA